MCKCAYRRPRWFSKALDFRSCISTCISPCVSSFHRFQENVFERIATEIESPDPHIALRGDAINVTNLDSISKDHLQPVRARGTLAPKLFDCFGKVAVGA